MQIFSKKKKNRDTHAHVHVSLLTNWLCIITITVVRHVVRKEGGWQEDASLFCSGEEGTRDGLSEFFSFQPGWSWRTLRRLQILFLVCLVSCARRKDFPRCIRRFEMKKLLISTEVLGLEGKLIFFKRRGEAFDSHWKSFWFDKNQYLRQGLNWAQENKKAKNRLRN